VVDLPLEEYPLLDQAKLLLMHEHNLK